MSSWSWRPSYLSVITTSRKTPTMSEAVTAHRDKILELNKWTRRMCAEHGFIYLDYHSRMADGIGHLEAALSSDGLHPNSEGYKRMAPIAEAAIAKALSAKPRRKKRFRIF